VRVKADFYHAHRSVLLMLLAATAALATGARYYGDFNNIILVAQHKGTHRGPEPPGIFEQDKHWERELSDTEKARIHAVLDIIPEGVETLLDVGCGDGRVTTLVAPEVRQAVGLDCALAALKRVRRPVHAVLAAASQLPFERRSIDLVLATEVIEHLPAGPYEAALSEMQRVARRYILVGVPLEEQVRRNDAVCPIDGERFNAAGHARSFTKRRLATLFPGFRLLRLLGCGAPRRFYYDPILLWVKQRLGGCWARPSYTVCPRCGTDLHATELRERNAVTRWCDARNTKIREKMDLSMSHGLALYQRDDASERNKST